MAEMAVVTGASSGIGLAYAERLARDGWDLLIVARTADRLREVADRISADHGVEVLAVAADLSQDEAVAELCAQIASLPVGMLVNDAGLAGYMPFGELPPERAAELVRVNVLAPVLLTRAAIPGMRELGHGTIVNVASLLAFSGEADAPHLPKRAVYAATKSFLVTFTQIVAQEVRDAGIRLQVVCPGIVRSEFHTRQGIDMSAVPRMEPEAVVDASMIDLERAEVVSAPGLADPTAWDRLAAVHGELMAATRATEVPDRYR
jgi:short-subunit dehydrogenase